MKIGSPYSIRLEVSQAICASEQRVISDEYGEIGRGVNEGPDRQPIKGVKIS
jgi:hypothetical protein